jgi:hypothetical protein
MTSHPKSIWKGSNKYHVPTAPAVMKPKPFIVWIKSPFGESATCRSCQRTFHALHSSQKHLVSSIDGRCYYCRDLKDNIKKPVTVSEQERKGTPSFPIRPITRELWSRGGRGMLHSKKDTRRFQDHNKSTGEKPSKAIHLGKLIVTPHDAKFMATECTFAIRRKVKFPFWSCCLQHRDNTNCTKAMARSKLTDKIRNPLDELKELSDAMSYSTKTIENIVEANLPLPDLDKLMDGL